MKSGQISLKELILNCLKFTVKIGLGKLIKELESGNFFMRFPPNTKVSDIKNYPSFNLRKEGVQVDALEWIGDMQPYGELKRFGYC